MAKNITQLVQLATRIPEALHKEARLYAVENGRSLMDLVTEALTEYLATKKKKES